MSNVVFLGARTDVVTKAQLASFLKCSTRSIENKVAEGMPCLPMDRFGRRRYRLTDVEAWLAGNRSTPDLESRVTAIEKRLGMR